MEHTVYTQYTVQAFFKSSQVKTSLFFFISRIKYRLLNYKHKIIQWNIHTTKLYNKVHD